MVGYYVHHVGRGHLHRAIALARAMRKTGITVCGLSSLPRPTDWHGEWVRLAPDDETAAPLDTTAHGCLHWVPRHDTGLACRSTALSGWMALRRPALLVVDVSVEVALLARLHGIPVAYVLQPGRRDDPAHLLGFGVADALVAFWPDAAGHGMTPGLPEDLRRRVRCVGALSRRPDPGSPAPSAAPSVALLLGAGGHEVSASQVQAARAAAPGWRWRVLGLDRSTWVADPGPVLASADVVVTHAGQNAVAEVAAAGRPALVVPQPRPHDEQLATAAVLARSWPVVVRSSWPAPGQWPDLLSEVAALPTQRWSQWADGGAEARFVELVLGLCGRGGRP